MFFISAILSKPLVLPNHLLLSLHCLFRYQSLSFPVPLRSLAFSFPSVPVISCFLHYFSCLQPISRQPFCLLLLFVFRDISVCFTLNSTTNCSSESFGTLVIKSNSPKLPSPHLLFKHFNLVVLRDSKILGTNLSYIYEVMFWSNSS